MIEINSDRLWSRIEALSRITDPAKPWTRRAFEPRFSEGRAWLEREFKSAGLSVTIDAGGNLLGRLPGTTPSLGALVRRLTFRHRAGRRPLRRRAGLARGPGRPLSPSGNSRFRCHIPSK